MARSKYRYSFVEAPSIRFICPVCRDILKDPQEATCCKEHICEECIRPIKNNKGSCPVCRNKRFPVKVNSSFNKKLNSQQVKCPNKNCSWSGALGELDEHVNSGTCSVSFPSNCGKMERREMDKDYCEVLPVTSPISPTSPTFSLAPTVKDSANDDYMEMIAHVNQCPYHAIGCLAANIPNLQHHMDSHFSKHLELSQKHIETLKDRERVIMKMEKDLTDKADAVLSKEMMLNAKEQEHATFKRRLEEQDVLLVVKNDEIRNLCNKIDELKKAKTSKELYVNLNSLTSFNENKYRFTMTEVSQYCKGDEMLHWESDVFYTHNEGYKMIFLVDFVLNSLRLSLCILPGEYDDKLPWPLRGMIKISLLNQRNDFNHYSYDFIYKESTSDLEAGRVLECQGRSKKNVSISRKLTVDELLQSVANKTSYLENNMINFSVSYIDLTFVNSSPGLAVTNTLC